MEEGQQLTVSFSSPAFRSSFIDMIARHRETGSWESIQETLPNGKTVHTLFRQIAVNPVNGKAAVALIVLAVM